MVFVATRIADILELTNIDERYYALYENSGVTGPKWSLSIFNKSDSVAKTSLLTVKTSASFLIFRA